MNRFVCLLLLSVVLCTGGDDPSSAVRRVFGQPALRDSITLVVPSTTSKTTVMLNLTHLQYVEGVATMLSELTGGATATPGKGGF